MDGNKRETRDAYCARMKARELADHNFEIAFRNYVGATSVLERTLRWRAVDAALAELSATFPFKK